MNKWHHIVLVVFLLLLLSPFLLGWVTPAEFFAKLKQFVVERIMW